MQRSKFDIVRADAGAGGMSISSGSSGASGVGASSSSSASAMCGYFPRLVLVGEFRDCARCPFGRRLSSPCLVHHDVVDRAIEDGAGKSGARLRLEAALEAAEDGHVAGLRVRSASWRDEAQYDVRELLLHGGHRALADVDAGQVPEKDPRLSFFARVQHVVQLGCELQECRRDGPAVFLRDVVSALLRQDGVCLGHLHDQHVQRTWSMLKATVNVVASLVLPCS